MSVVAGWLSGVVGVAGCSADVNLALTKPLLMKKELPINCCACGHFYLFF